MKPRVALLLMSLLVSWKLRAQSDDFDAQLGKIRDHSSRIQFQLRGLGISTQEDRSDSLFDNDSKDKARPLFEVHGDLKLRMAAVGNLVFGRLVNRLVVSSEAHPVLIKLDTDQGAFSGLTVQGTARQGGNPERVQLELGRLLLHSGQALPVVAQGLDEEGALGIRASVMSAKAWAEVGALAGSLIAGMASAHQTQTTNGLGFTNVQPTGRNALLQGVAQTAADGSKRLIEQATREKPVLIVEPGAKISVFFSEELRL